jgi:NitT/TauT family transport system permease protein
VGFSEKRWQGMFNINLDAEKLNKFGINKLFTPKEDISRSLYLTLGVQSFIIFFILWCVLTYGGFIKPAFLPAPHIVVQAGVKLFTEFDLISDIWASAFRVGMGFIIAAAIGVPLGILMGTLTVVAAFVEPIMGFIRYMPSSAFIPLLILWVGIGETEKVAVIFIGTFFQLVLMVMNVTKGVSKDLIDVSYTLGTNKKTVFTKIILPAALPGIVDTLRITCGWAWTYLVVAEIVAANSGLGYMIMQSQRYLKTPNIFVGIFIIGILGLITDFAFRFIYKRLFPWMGKEGV